MTEHQKILQKIEALRTGSEPFCVATIVRTADATSAKAGAKAIVTGNGQLEGYVGGSCVGTAVVKAAVACIKNGQAQLIRVKPNDELSGPIDKDGTNQYGSGCPSGGTVDIFLEPQLANQRIVVCGSSPVAAALVQIATSVGISAVHACADADTPMLAYATSQVKEFDLTTLALTDKDAVVVVTQGVGDQPALRAALLSGAGYIGMVGSGQKVAHLKNQIENDSSVDISEQRLSQLHGPAGLDIGAIAPEEIALSIVAQIIAYRRQSNSKNI